MNIQANMQLIFMTRIWESKEGHGEGTDDAPDTP